ncbi:diguanylate cyclase [Mycobacterium sp. 852013-51886_SCH5428379]|uniref:GGDEF domain-containing protein n=1 Tax=Mycobacterium sp. 852013-51886_SCH5428379 TaxID=1834111 RepID=UPI0007FEC8A3|nr:GGDEF domain-containing protein [Mycobacterium sp. 852013-51886_SCH5428379]OBB58328.1 diguanylate cyclase [Mycobacterium sp. 852013-51886_SCH5428379]
MLSAVREWWRQPDHYYWLTAFLATRGAQRATCRLIAVALVGFAAALLISLPSPAGPSGTVGTAVTLLVSGWCAVMAVMWVRKGWLTQRQSVVFAVTASILISAATLVKADPLNGMFGAMAFAVLAVYIAFFHTPRLAAANFAIATVTASVMAVAIAVDGDLALAISTLLFLIVVNLATPLVCQTLVHVLGIDVLNSDIEPLTGLFNREAFQRAVAASIAGRSRDDDRFLVLVVIELDNFALLVQSKGRRAGERARVATAQTLRETTRRGAVVAHIPQAEFLIADSFATTDSSPLVERVRSAIKSTPPRTSASIGVVSTPMRGLAQRPPYEVLDELLNIARNAVIIARSKGGNRAHHVECPPLTPLEDDEPLL